MNDEISIAVICGSLRAASFNAAIARELSAMAPAGVTVRQLEGLETFPHYNFDVQAQGVPALVKEWADVIRAADAIIFVTPEYNYSIPGVLKNALDWVSRLSPAPFSGKSVAIQTASIGMLGGARAQYHLRQVLLYLDAFVLNKPEIMIPDVASKISEDGKIIDDMTRQLISEQLVALKALIERVGVK